MTKETETGEASVERPVGTPLTRKSRDLARAIDSSSAIASGTSISELNESRRILEEESANEVVTRLVLNARRQRHPAHPTDTIQNLHGFSTVDTQSPQNDLDEMSREYHSLDSNRWRPRS